MVAWYADGLLAGYDPAGGTMGYVYHFASPDSVDLQAETRIQYALNVAYGQSASDFSRRFNCSAPITFAQADITAMGGKPISMGLIVVPAAAWPAGKVPTPQEIYAKALEPNSGAGISFGDQYWSTIGSTPIDHLYTLAMNVSGSANTKWWILLTPVRIMSLTGGTNFTNIIPMGAVNGTYWTYARAISAWVNQRPTKPVITSPSQEAAPGTVINIDYTPSDPDSTLPDDTKRYNRDLAAVEFQYARVPTPDNPNVEWKHLMFKVAQFTVSGSTWSELGNSSYCRVGTNQGYQQGVESPHDPRKASLIESLQMKIYCGYAPSDPTSSLDYGPDSEAWPVGTAALTGGDWQVRMRTFDFGHAYGNNPAVSPLGVMVPYDQWIHLESYPASNTSDWSDPVQVSVVSQVPPPVPLSPTQDIAIEEGGVTRLSWQYLNTHVPAYAQTFRTVQIRKVGDPTWKTVVDDMSAQTYIDLPASLVQPSSPPQDYEPDPSFEGGTLGGWTVHPNTQFTPAVIMGTAANVSGNARTGTKSLRMLGAIDSTSGNGTGSMVDHIITPNPAHNLFNFTGFVKGLPSEGAGLIARLSWRDASNQPIIPADVDAFDPSTYGPYADYFIQISTNYTSTGYVPFDLSVKRHPLGVTLAVEVQMLGSGSTQAPASGWNMDDVSLIGQSGALDDFTLSATNEYEWRVQVIDFDGVKSDWSEPARFWIVEPAGTGPIRPTALSLIEGATLGCGTHRAFIYRRGGKVRVGELTQISHVDWGRLRDDVSTASVVVSGWTEDCGNLLASLQTWAYELVIYRNNGYTVDRVWEGPITLLTYEVDQVTINARDVVAYPYRRIIKQDMSDTKNGDTVVNRATRVIQNTMAPDDPNVLAYLTPIRRDDDAREYRSTPAYSRTAFEEVDDMAANAGLDYTAVGRSIILWDTSHRIGTLPEFKDDDLGSPPIVSEYGMSMANRYSVSDGQGVHGEAERLDASGHDPIFGLVEMLSSTWASDSEEDTGTYTEQGKETVRQSFKDFAERSIKSRYPPPVVVRVPDNTTLNAKALVSIQQLVPGVAIPLRSTGTLRSVVATQKLDSIKVVEEKGVETITVTMSPFGSDDAAVDQEVS